MTSKKILCRRAVVAISLRMFLVAVAISIVGCDSEHSAHQSPTLPAIDRAQVSIEQRVKAEQDLKALLARLDAKAASLSPAAWIPPVEVDREIARAAAGAQIEKAGCANEFCRYTVTVKSEQDKKTFPQQLIVHGAVMFDYPADKPLTIVTYIFNPTADLRSL